jgi:hypothetical protein
MLVSFVVTGKRAFRQGSFGFGFTSGFPWFVLGVGVAAYEKLGFINVTTSRVRVVIIVVLVVFIVLLC